MIVHPLLETLENRIRTQLLIKFSVTVTFSHAADPMPLGGDSVSESVLQIQSSCKKYLKMTSSPED